MAKREKMISKMIIPKYIIWVVKLKDIIHKAQMKTSWDSEKLYIDLGLSYKIPEGGEILCPVQKLFKH